LAASHRLSFPFQFPRLSNWFIARTRNFSRASIEKAIGADGFQLWRLRDKVSAAQA